MNRSLSSETYAPRAQIEQILNDLIHGDRVPSLRSEARGQRRERMFSDPEASRTVPENSEPDAARGVRGRRADSEI